MPATVLQKSDEYLLNHCTKYLARDVTEPRHSPFGVWNGQRRASISECWRFPVVDSHDGATADAYEPVSGPMAMAALVGLPSSKTSRVPPLRHLVFAPSERDGL